MLPPFYLPSAVSVEMDERVLAFTFGLAGGDRRPLRTGAGAAGDQAGPRRRDEGRRPRIGRGRRPPPAAQRPGRDRSRPRLHPAQRRRTPRPQLLPDDAGRARLRSHQRPHHATADRERPVRDPGGAQRLRATDGRADRRRARRERRGCLRRAAARGLQQRHAVPDCRAPAGRSRQPAGLRLQDGPGRLLPGARHSARQRSRPDRSRCQGIPAGRGHQPGRWRSASFPTRTRSASGC